MPKVLPLAVALEPNGRMTRPYIYLERSFKLVRFTSLAETSLFLQSDSPDLVLCSCSLPPTQILTFLDRIKNQSSTFLIPLVMVVDCSQKISNFIGTTWGGQLGVLTSLASHGEIHSTLMRIVQHRQIIEQVVPS